jgi:RNA polymerase sigma-70 factor (ECF subfamily)
MQPRAWSMGHTGGGTRLSADADQADVEKVLAGDVDAFEHIVRRWEGPLVNLAYRFCRDRSRAEDMAQDAFLRAYRALGGWRKDAAFSTWLFALATNLYRSELRRIPPRTLPLDEVSEARDQRDPLTDAEEDSRDRAVRHAVLALPSKYREALTLYYFHEKDVAQAAQSLGVAEGTVKARLNRGREILRGKLPRLLRELNFKETP